MLVNLAFWVFSSSDLLQPEWTIRLASQQMCSTLKMTMPVNVAFVSKSSMPSIAIIDSLATPFLLELALEKLNQASATAPAVSPFSFSNAKDYKFSPANERTSPLPSLIFEVLMYERLRNSDLARASVSTPA